VFENKNMARDAVLTFSEDKETILTYIDESGTLRRHNITQ